MNLEVSIKSEIDVQEILDKRGLGKDKRAWKYAGARFKAYADKYVPFKQGTLKNTAVVTATSYGACVKYVQPYAHYQYYGRTMGPNVLTKRGWRSMAKKGGKYYTGGSLSYSGSGRGSEWDKKTLAAKKADLINDIAKYVGGHT